MDILNQQTTDVFLNRQEELEKDRSERSSRRRCVSKTKYLTRIRGLELSSAQSLLWAFPEYFALWRAL